MNTAMNTAINAHNGMTPHADTHTDTHISRPIIDWQDTIVDLAVTPNAHLDETGNVIPGIYLNLPNEDYHALPGISSTIVKNMYKESPYHTYKKYFCGAKRELTYAQKRTFDFGTLGHEIVLENAVFTGHFYPTLNPDDYPNTHYTTADLVALCSEHGLAKSGTKNAIAKRLAEAGVAFELFEDIEEAYMRKMSGDEAVDEAKAKYPRMDLCNAMREEDILPLAKMYPIEYKVWHSLHRVKAHVDEHPLAKNLLANGYPELSIFAICPQTGELLKCRFDWLNPIGIAGDLKTTRSTNPYELSRQSLALGYHLQEAHYTYVASLAGITLEDFVFIAVEHTDVTWCELFRFSDQRKAHAKELYFTNLSELSTCIQRNHWHGYSSDRSILTFD